MIHREATIKYAGYDPNDLGLKSSKRICMVCDKCGRVRWGNKYTYHNLCHKCSLQDPIRNKKLSLAQKGKTHSDETKQKLSDLSKGKPKSKEHRKKISLALKGKPKSDKHRQNIIKNHVGMTGKKHTDKTKQKMSENNIGMRGYEYTDKTRQKMSESKIGKNNPNWQGGISSDKYCRLFNDKFKELIRNLYNRKCFLCDKTEKENNRKLDVHHVNYNKGCLCGIQCEFVPLCQTCHGKTNCNRKYWKDLIMCYLYPERYFIVDI